MRFAFFPYLDPEGWLFDDDAVGVSGTPLVLRGATELIDDLIADLPQPKSAFRLLLASLPFRGWSMELALEDGDGWYVETATGLEVRLSPTLLRPWPKPPEWLYLRAESLSVQ